MGGALSMVFAPTSSSASTVMLGTTSTAVSSRVVRERSSGNLVGRWAGGTPQAVDETDVQDGQALVFSARS